MIITIALRELRSLFLSPLAWAILAVLLFILAYVFLVQIQVFVDYQPRLAGMESAPGVTEIVAAPLFEFAAILLLLVAPLLTHGSIAGERRAGTLILLQAAPVSSSQIVFGKFVALTLFFSVLVMLVAAMPLSLAAGTVLDWRHLAACVITLVLLLGAFSAIGLFLSALVEEPVIAAVMTFGALLLLKILDWATSVASEEGTSAAFRYLSMSRHYEPMLGGRFSSIDVLYFVIFTATFLALAVWRLNEDRLQR
ncbi:MAG: ABC transporter permease [Chromatiales bacterium]